MRTLSDQQIAVGAAPFVILAVAYRRNSNWGAVAGFTVVGLVMATILVFGLPL